MNSSQALIAAPTPLSHPSAGGHSAAGTKNFDSLGLDRQLIDTVLALGYTEPTPIQVRAIPEVLAGKDLVGLAQTGTGKTAAFLLPIIQKLIAAPSGAPRVLIVVPTRELAEQVLEAARALSKGTQLRSMSMYGGVRAESQIRQLRQPLDIIVGCPGRILDLLEQRALSLSAIEYLVLDEADQMFDMGFIVPIRKLLRALPRDRQSLLFSATMPPEISSLADEALHHPVKIQVSPISSPATVTHIAYPVAAHLKQKLLTHLLKTMASESVLIFTRTKHKAKKLARYLEGEGIVATSLQGNLSQQQRMHAMKGFRSGKYSVMVATDIASRGIDVSSVTHVVNFDLPDTTEAYLHRTGRTGRAARNGDALSFITPSDEGEIKRIERALRLPFKRKTVEEFDYSAKPDPAAEHIGGYSHAGRGGGERRNRSSGGGRPRSSGGDRSRSFGGDRPRDGGGYRGQGGRGRFEDRSAPRSEHRADGQPSAPRGEDRGPRVSGDEDRSQRSEFRGRQSSGERSSGGRFQRSSGGSQSRFRGARDGSRSGSHSGGRDRSERGEGRGTGERQHGSSERSSGQHSSGTGERASGNREGNFRGSSSESRGPRGGSSSGGRSYRGNSGQGSRGQGGSRAQGSRAQGSRAQGQGQGRFKRRSRPARSDSPR